MDAVLTIWGGFRTPDVQFLGSKGGCRNPLKLTGYIYIYTFFDDGRNPAPLGM